MIWQEIIVNRKLTLDEVTLGLCKVFALKPSEVMVVEEISKAFSGEHVKVICERTRISGEFHMILSIYTYDSKLTDYNKRRTIGRFCEILNCTCLISDDSVNPYSWILVQNCKDYKPTFLDTIKLDEHEEYVIVP